VTYDGQVKILDFGIAKAAVNAPSETETGVLKGKLRYMAPEQIAGEAVDRRADLFAVGAILWEVLADQRIWSGVSDMAVMQRVTSGDIPSPRSVNPDVPEILEAICVKAMSMEPEKRYATAEEFQVALEDALGTLGRVFKARDLGQRVSELFADHRAEIRAVIETQMRRVEGLSSTQMESFSPVPLALPLMPTPSGARADAPRAAADRRSRWRSLALVTGGVALASAFFIWQGAHRPAPAAPSAVVAPAVVAPETVKSPSRSRVTVTVVPAQARAFFDGTELPANPYSGTYDQDGALHHVRAEAAGYVPQTVDVALDHDTSVSIALEREKPAARAARPERLSSTRPTAPPSSAAPAKPSCAEPYFVDEKGIKRIRPECF
jgi:serine/threonine-protein kinase